MFKQGAREDRVTLVAHADTVFTGKRSLYGYGGFYDLQLDDESPAFRPRQIDTRQGIASSIVNGQEIIHGTNPNVGIGADDRAGCAILWLLQNSGHNLLITDAEEIGRIGAKYLMREHPAIIDEINKSRFAVEFDRRGADDYKCYEIPVEDEFKKYIEAKTGFKDAGTFSVTDISELCKDICGVNLSTGYYNEHTPRETLNVNQWLNTLNLIRNMLAEKIPTFSLDEQVRERLRQQREMMYKRTWTFDDQEYQSLLIKYEMLKNDKGNDISKS